MDASLGVFVSECRSFCTKPHVRLEKVWTRCFDYPRVGKLRAYSNLSPNLKINLRITLIVTLSNLKHK